MAKNLLQFAREVRLEGNKVTWPTRKETITTTIVVFIMVAVMAVILLFSDWVISSAVEFILSFGR